MDDKNKAQPPPYPTQPGMAPYPAQPNAGMPPYPPQPGPAVYGAPAPYPPQSNQGFNFGQPVSHIFDFVKCTQLVFLRDLISIIFSHSVEIRQFILSLRLY